MAERESDNRSMILGAARELVAGTNDPKSITVRQVAQRAGVGTGLVNYHFGSKDKLFAQVVGEMMADTIAAHEAAPAHGTPPAERLKELLKELYGVGEEQMPLMRYLLGWELTEGNLEAPLYLVPLLREVFAGQADEMRLRVMALQILQPIQAAALNPGSFRLYCGIDLTDPAQRDRFIDSLVENLIKGEEK
ncbi:TetR/AcrR family transcriptional regulator [Ruminococcaceae bacterium OttesenSCG-928-I18]|nr:TetR/AcrR family transcriptional regulator [Ruminococcaceae bacterium OttesenSCG-928-I18]